jgi:nicotinate-nucleotide adenylyltransferase
MSIPPKGIGLFSGSFDPVHNGHLAVARSFLKSGYLTELWILLTPDPPHKSDVKLTDYDLRLDMLQAAFKDMENVHLSSIENKLPNPSYTVRTLRYFYNQYVGRQFYLCLGEDSVMNFNKWQNWREILSYCDLLAARRPNTGVIDLEEEIAQQTHFISHEPVDISSTEIRQRVAEGKSITHFVPYEVEKIINDKNLYQDVKTK